jgi:L-ascorbate metabolism protein UlaG (beta-lactamase superfamily)
MKLTYHGHSCVEVEHGPHRLIFDPFLSGNPNADKRPEDIRVQYVLLTHGHGDHVGDAEQIAKQNDATIIAPYELAMYFAQKGIKVHPMQHGGKWNFEFGTVKLTLAFHGSGLEVGNQLLYAGNPCGILLTMEGKTFYHAGDTALFGDMKLIGERHNIDVAALPIGDNFTMGPEDAVDAAVWLRAKHVIPIHYDTFDLIKQDTESFVSELKARGIEASALKPGESLTI